MSQARFNDQLKPLSPGMRLREAVNAQRQNALAELVRTAVDGRNIRSGPGIRVRNGPQGATVALARSRPLTFGAGAHPFFIRLNGTFHAGVVNSSLVPVYEGDPIGEEGNAIDLTAFGGNFYVYLKAEFNLVFGSHNFLTSAALNMDGTPLEIVVDNNVLTDELLVDGGTLTAYRMIAQVVNGVVQREQVTKTNLYVSVCDASDGTTEGRSCAATWGAEI